MRSALVVAAAALLVMAALTFLFREPLRETAYALLTQDMFLAGDHDSFDPGPAVGTLFPGLQATYQGRRITLINEFAGHSGTLFIASRSLDWCPYCMRQMLQLQENKPLFDQAGIGLVAITYDSPMLQQAFIDKFAITIPILSDLDALSFKTLGILNGTYKPGDREYGIAHPGMIVIDPNGIVVGKLFLEDYRSRVDARAALAFARTTLGIDPP